MKWQILNARLFSKKGHGLVLQDGKIAQVLDKRQGLSGVPGLDLHGMLLLPGLTNGHDSLMASYHPIEPLNFPYKNWLAYDNEVKTSPLFEERMTLDLKLLYALGGYKNIIAGATSVVDHIPHFVRNAYKDYSLAYVLPDYGISHSVCSYSLGWGEGHRKEYERACKLDLPFIVHIAEGFDKESKESLANLDAIGALGENTVLVHGISLSEKDLDLIAEKQAHLVWCPSSNLRIYGKTLDVSAALERGINVCLGTDSAMTGSTNLLEEMGTAREYYRSFYNEELPPESLAAFVTKNARKAFRIQDRGLLSEGQYADLLVLHHNPDTTDEADILTQASLKQVFLVIRNGQPVYGDESLREFFEYFGTPVVRVHVEGEARLIVAEFLELVTKIKKDSLSYRPFPFLPVEVVL